MESSSLLALYDSQLRTDAEFVETDEVTAIGPLLAGTFPTRRRGLITYAPLSAAGDELEGLVASALAHYAADPRVDEVEWKSRGHDHLPGLHEQLEYRGFHAGETETVMAGPVEAAIRIGTDMPDSYRVERADTETAVREAETLAGRVFGTSPERSRRKAEELVARFRRSPASFETWVVRDPSGQVVCSGRADFIDATSFVTLWGGACDEEHRGRGLYRAITTARAQSAASRGKKYLQVDCTRYSRPILERAGLTALTTTTPYIWTRP